MTYHYCIEEHFSNKFRNWNDFDKLLKADIIGADLAYYSYSVKNIKLNSNDYDSVGIALVDKLESLIFINLDKSNDELMELYLDFLNKNIKYPKKDNRVLIDKEKENKRRAAEEKAIAEEKIIQSKKERIKNHKYESLRNNLERLLPNVSLSLCEKAAYDKETDQNFKTDITLSCFSPNGITNLANRTTYKLYYERYLYAHDYKILDFDDSDESIFPDIDYKNEIL